MKIGLKVALIVLFFTISKSIVLADHISVSGDVSGEWSADTVRVTGDLTVPDGEILVISPGTILEFQGSYAFYVKGSLSAQGLADDSIYFQVADTSGFAIDSIPRGGWKGVRFDHIRNSNDPSVFSHCRFSFGKAVSDDPLAGSGGAIYIDAFNKVSIGHCLFIDNFATFNGGAVYLDSADIAINNSTFLNNRCGPLVAPWGYGGAICSDNSSPDIRWNIFDNNSSTGVGGGLAVRFKDCNVYNNIFTGNLSGLGGGLGILHIPEINYRVNNNLIAENQALYFGGGVASLDASPFYINNTIAGNVAAYGGGFYCKDSISPSFYNTIIWGNNASVGPQGYFFEVYSQADFFNCDVEGGPGLFGGSGGGEAFSGVYENCLDADPEFLGFGDHPYTLYLSSPCMDEGSADTSGFMLPGLDLAHNQRVILDIIDIGAYEVNPFGVEENINENEVKVWPNPTDGKFKVQSASWLTKFKAEVEKIEVSDIFGKVMLSKDIMISSDPVELDISHLQSGIYLVRISEGNNNFIKKLIKISHR